MNQYRTHRCLATHTGVERLSDTVAWFPETLHAPSPSSPKELLQAAILDLKKYVKRYLTGDAALPSITSLVADMEDLALMYNPALPESAAEQRVSTPPLNTPQVSSNEHAPAADTRVPMNMNRPNEPLTSTALPTVPTAPAPPYRTHSTTAAERASSPIQPTYQALAYPSR
jgi:hypothetical protein